MRPRSTTRVPVLEPGHHCVPASPSVARAAALVLPRAGDPPGPGVPGEVARPDRAQSTLIPG